MTRCEKVTPLTRCSVIEETLPVHSCRREETPLTRCSVIEEPLPDERGEGGTTRPDASALTRTSGDGFAGRAPPLRAAGTASAPSPCRSPAAAAAAAAICTCSQLQV